MPSYYRSRRNNYRRRPKRLKKILVWLAVISFAFGGIQLIARRTSSSPQVALYDLAPKTQPIPETILPNGVQAAMTNTSSRVVAASSTDAPTAMPIASMAKVVTAVAVQQKSPIKPGQTGIEIVFDDDDEALYREYLANDGTVTNVKTGESINQYQALQAILLPSSNNMSDTLAKRVFGSVKDYTNYANKLVRELGMKDTFIADASGFSPLTISTPTDMLLIGQKLMQDPVLAEIVAQEQADIPVAGLIRNHNILIKEPDVVGIKPGYTDEAGLCLLFAAKASPADSYIIGVVMGAETSLELLHSSKQLLADSQNILNSEVIIQRGQAVGELKAPWLDKPVKLIAKTETALDADQLNKPADNVILQNQSADEAEVSLSASNQSTIPVRYQSQMTSPSWWWRLRHLRL